jgi:mono/diheme cytochrome c family protein
LKAIKVHTPDGVWSACIQHKEELAASVIFRERKSMKKKMRGASLFAVIVGGFWIVLLPWQLSPAQEQGSKSAQEQQSIQVVTSLEGPDIFRVHCATCHGTNGQGGGPVAAALKTKVPDLTTISKRNGGVFPDKRVRAVIAGDEGVAAHGSRDMPIWGPIFHQIERDRDFGNIRMESITKYVESIQRK